MIHVLLDSCIYRADPKRQKQSFRALTRLTRAGRVRVHIPAYVKGEVVSQQQLRVREELAKLMGAADSIPRSTSDATILGQINQLLTLAKELEGQADKLLAAEFQSWIDQTNSIEHAVKPEHGERVTAAYFAGTLPFRSPKSREDFPDGFIWQTALDLAAEHGGIVVVSTDKRLRKTAEDQGTMDTYETLDAFIEDDECQDAIAELITSERVAQRIQRIKKLLPNTPTDDLLRSLTRDVIHDLSGKTVRHRSIPDDNHEGTIISVWNPENVEFDFTNLEHYGDADIGIPFTATVDCELSYAIFKSDYYCLDEEEMEGTSISDLNRHYYEASKTFTIRIAGHIALMIDPADLEEVDLTDEDLQATIKNADTDTEITEKEVEGGG